ncbi:DUF2786 domain-containing protein [Alkalicoccobacillus gibsonii]|uniref:DUF2786 domain-containing protein n=1 Tax=Alkalicoccobacillus gibsonii TaxID=79881 RepID=A0ABU9VPQ0_9BACI
MNQHLEERIKRRIQKSLALASNNPNAEEAHTALLKAQRLMYEHGFKENDFQGEVKKEILEVTVGTYKKLMWYEKHLAGIVARNFRCFNYYNTKKSKPKVKGGRSITLYRIAFYGEKKDAEIAKEVYSHALIYMSHLCENFMNDNGYIKAPAIRNDYRNGFLMGLNEKLDQQVQEYGLIVVMDEEVKTDYKEKVQANFTGSVKVQHKEILSLIAFEQGQEDGNMFDHERKNLS